ncbi:phage holin [Jeotgalibaca porci]|uniref:phage holin n=1 Tax=Jeotgalibaca porci TaxID=1868793 RepID=UPI0035A1C8F0
MLSNKQYDIIKWVVILLLPALSVLVGTLGQAYGFVHTDLAVTTINAVTVFLGVITGVSTYQHNKEDDN